MSILTTFLNNPDAVIGTVILLVLTLFIVHAFRSARPDPESARLLRLLNQLPNHEDETGESLLAADEGVSSHSPLGPGSFSLLTSNAHGLDDGRSATEGRAATESRPAPATPSRTKVV